MADSYSGKLQIWEGWSGSLVPATGFSSAADNRQALPVCPWLAAEMLASPGKPVRLEGPEPYSLQWFLDLEHLRLQRHGRWIPAALEFTKHAGENLLGLGAGLGTDWVQYARHGAAVTVCSPSSEQLALVRRNFELRELSGRFLHAPPSHLPVETASMDVACLTQLPAVPAEISRLLDEVYRVLKPGGKVLALAPALYDVDFWSRVLYPWKRWLVSREASHDQPRYTARQLKNHFARFVEHRVHKRHLRRGDVPHIWRLLPSSVLERLVGRCLVVKAFKPLSAAIPTALAA